MRKKLMMLVAGLSVCGLSTAATTINLELPTAKVASMKSAIGTASRIQPAVQTARFLPEVYVGNGTRPGSNVTERNDESSDDTADDLAQDEP